MKEVFEDKLLQVFSSSGFELSKTQIEQFYNYYTLLIEWNNKFNLTAITEMDQVIEKHFLDSCAGVNLLETNASVIDIGAGAGFPSVPLKIIRPDLKVLMVDSVNKKIGFLQEVISKLKLYNISTIHSRAEDLAVKPDKRECFDYCVSRAVASLNTLAEYSLPFVKVGGKMLAYKSFEIDEELNNSKSAISTLGGKIEKIHTFSVKGIDRKIVEIKKELSTPKKYPRSGNKPRLMPL